MSCSSDTPRFAVRDSVGIYSDAVHRFIWRLQQRMLVVAAFGMLATAAVSTSRDQERRYAVVLVSNKSSRWRR